MCGGGVVPIDTFGRLNNEPARTHTHTCRAHIQLCWLALLLIRTIEHQAQDTWRNIRHELDRMHLVTLQSADGRVAQRSVTTPGQQHIFKALSLTEPARFHDFALTEPGE